MIDAPFRVERSVRLTVGDSATISYAIVRTGVGIVCWCDDSVYAYRIVELLNEVEVTPEVKPASGDSPGR
jgi:hypothetical protein